MRRLGPCLLMPLLFGGCSLSLDWALPQAPGADGAADAAQIDLGPAIEDTPDAGPELDASPDAPKRVDAAAEAGDPDGAGLDVPLDAAPGDSGTDSGAPQDNGCRCPVGEECIHGLCSRACPAGMTRCGVACFDLSNTLLHCGACNNACRPGLRCCAGVCAMRCG